MNIGTSRGNVWGGSEEQILHVVGEAVQLLQERGWRARIFAVWPPDYPLCVRLAQRLNLPRSAVAKHYLHGVVPVGKFLADQLLLPMAIAGYGRFRTLNPTFHTLTNIEIIKKFLNVQIENKPLGEEMWEISIKKE